jgi:hypothetical protein
MSARRFIGCGAGGGEVQAVSYGHAGRTRTVLLRVPVPYQVPHGARVKVKIESVKVEIQNRFRRGDECARLL